MSNRVRHTTRSRRKYQLLRIKHVAAKAAASGATVLLSNHSEFDNAVNKNRMLAGRGEGPHPYELGADWVQRYFQVMQGCARAAQVRLEQKQADTAKQ